MFFSTMVTHFALHIAAPHELALAFLLDVSYPSLVASPATQQSASVDTVRRPIAEATSSAHNADAMIGKRFIS